MDSSPFYIRQVNNLGIGANVQKIAQEREVSLKELSRRAGIPYTTIYNMVKRDSSRVPPENLQKLADALTVGVGTLCGLDSLGGEKMQERLVKARESVGYNRKEFAGILGIPYRTVTNYENGSREPGWDYLIKVANFCGCTTDWLLGLNDGSLNSIPRENKDDILKGRLLSACGALNDVAIEKVIAYAEELSYNPRNKKTNNE